MIPVLVLNPSSRRFKTTGRHYVFLFAKYDHVDLFTEHPDFLSIQATYHFTELIIFLIAYQPVPSIEVLFNLILCIMEMVILFIHTRPPCH